MWPFKGKKSTSTKEVETPNNKKKDDEWEYCGSDDDENHDEYEYGYVTVSEDEDDDDDDHKKVDDTNFNTDGTPEASTSANHARHNQNPPESTRTNDTKNVDYDDDDDDDDVVDQLLAVSDQKSSSVPPLSPVSPPSSMKMNGSKDDAETHKAAIPNYKQEQEEPVSPETEIPLAKSERMTSAGTASDELFSQQQQQQQHPPEPVLTPPSPSSKEANVAADYHQEKAEEKKGNQSFASEEGTKSIQTEDSALDHDDDDDDDEDHDDDDEPYSDEELDDMDDESLEEEESEEEDDDDDDEGPTSLAEKQSLLALAAEHDRVDILKAILAESSSQEREQLLHQTGVPPLHVAVSYGSTHATSCFLRMGANPAIRPTLQDIQQNAQLTTAAEQQKEKGGGSSPSRTSSAAPRSITHLQKYVSVTAWELAFGTSSTNNEEQQNNNHDVPMDNNTATNNDDDQPPSSVGSWFGGMFSGGNTNSSREKLLSKKEEQELPSASAPPSSGPPPTFKPVDMAPSKREGIRHAFTAEALRCIGADEVTRLQQLLDSGMPSTIDVGGKTLHGWCVEMGAPQCEDLIRPSPPLPKETLNQEKTPTKGDEEDDIANGERHVKEENIKDVSVPQPPPGRVASPRALPDGTETLASLVNRQEELESLASALSGVLDNLAEEVSVCHGLLLLGGGASALASHVRSLKDLQERRRHELSKAMEEWEYSQDELAYCVRELKSITTPTSGDLELLSASQLPSLSSSSPSRQNLSDKYNKTPPPTKDEEEGQRRQLFAQLAASENKVRKLRASITDLSEENTRDLEEVEKRGLSGGIKLVRTLREELRELEFKLSETKNEEATCRAKTNLIRSRLDAEKKLQQQQNATVDQKTSAEQGVNANEPKKIKVLSTVDHESKDNGTNGKDASTSLVVVGEENSMEPKETPAVVSSDEQESASSHNATMEREVIIGNASNDIDESSHDDEDQQSSQESSAKLPASESILAGQSTEIALRQPGGRGFTPMILWDIFVRIMGLGRAAVKHSADNLRGTASSVMIV